MKMITAGLAGAVVLWLSGAALAGPPIAWATRTNAFTSNSTTGVIIPLRNDGTTALNFETTEDNQRVVITYNAECIAIAQRGIWLTISIFVDGTQIEPASGSDFALCSAVDVNGGSWAAVTRQSVVTVPTAGTHTVNISGRLRGGTGTFGLDDSSLVVQGHVRAVATNKNPFTSSATVATELPLKDNGATTLNFNTGIANDEVKLSYNAECVVDAAPPSHVLSVNFVVDGTQPGVSNILCGRIDTDAKTWAGTLRQHVVTVPSSGAHQLKVIGALNNGPGSWRVDDSSLVVTRSILASGAHEEGVPSTSSTDPQSVPLRSNGGVTLSFTTTEPNQIVKFGFSATCRIGGPRGRWLGVRVVVEGVEASPNSGYDFAFCSSALNGFLTYHHGYRQSVMVVPTPGQHNVRVFARLSPGDPASWGLSTISMVVE